jgi:hypothetical protein
VPAVVAASKTIQATFVARIDYASGKLRLEKSPTNSNNNSPVCHPKK